MRQTTKQDLEAASFWGEAVCLACGTVQTERAAGEPCQACETPGTVPASVALQFINLVEESENE